MRKSHPEDESPPQALGMLDKTEAGKRLPLNALAVFERVASLGSLKSAATALHRTPSAVSHQVRELEAALDRPLLVRSHRSIELTPAGQTLFTALRPAFEAIGTAYDEAARLHDKPLRVSLASGYASTFVLPRVAELHRLLDHRRIAVEVTAKRAEVGKNGVDIAVRFGPKPAGDFEVILLRNDDVLIVAAPSLFSRDGQLKGRMESLPLMGQTQHPTLWDEALRQLGLQHVGARMMFDSFAAVLEAAAQGLGLALTPASVCAHLVESKRLQVVENRPLRNGWAYWLIARNETSGRREIARVRDWLISQSKIEPNHDRKAI